MSCHCVWSLTSSIHVSSLTTYFPNTHLNVTISFPPRSFTWPIYNRFSHENSYSFPFSGSHDSSVLLSWATGWTIGVLGFDSRRGMGIFLFTTESRTALGPTQLPIQWVPGALSLEVKRPGREADHWPPSSAEVKEYVELYLHYPNTPSWHAAQLKAQGIPLLSYPTYMHRPS
jgi:hypothetical protein